MPKYYVFALVAVVISACGGGGGGGGAPAGGNPGGGDNTDGGNNTGGGNPPALVVNKLSGDVLMATGANGFYVGNNFLSDIGGTTYQGEKTFTLGKNQTIEGMAIQKDSSGNVVHAFRGFKAVMENGDFVEFQPIADGSGPSAAQVTVDVYPNNERERADLIETFTTNSGDASRSSYRYTHSGSTEVLDFEVFPIYQGQLGLKIGHSVSVVSGGATIASVNSGSTQKSVSTDAPDDVQWTAVARDDSGKGWKGVVFVSDLAPISGLGFDQVIKVPNATIELLKARYGTPLSRGDRSHKAIIQELIKLHGSELVEPTPSTTVNTTKALNVNDPEAINQPYLDTDILDFATAWNTSTGVGVDVCVVDTGGDFTHEDIVGQISSRSNTQNETDDISSRFQGVQHGLTVAGTIAAARNNSIGIAGASDGVNLHFIRASEQNNLDNPDIFTAIERCIDDVQADIINLSLATVTDQLSTAGDFPESLNKKIVSFINNGGFVVQGSGNEARQIADTAVTKLPGYVYVGALGAAGDGTSYSNLGTSIDVSVFGGEINGPRVRVLTNGNTYSGFAGTSYSTPLVTSVIALMLEEYPNMTGSEFERALHELRFNDELESNGLGFTGISAKRAVDAAVAMRNTPYRMLTDAYSFRHSGAGDLVVTVSLANALTETLQLNTSVNGDTLVFQGLENVTATSFDARFTVPENVTKDTALVELVFALPDESLTITVAHNNAKEASANIAASYANKIFLVGDAGNGEEVIKVLGVEDVSSTDDTRFTLSNVDVPEAVTSVRVALDMDGDGVFCGQFDYCSEPVAITNDVTGAEFVIGDDEVVLNK